MAAIRLTAILLGTGACAVILAWLLIDGAGFDRWIGALGAGPTGALAFAAGMAVCWMLMSGRPRS